MTSHAEVLAEHVKRDVSIHFFDGKNTDKLTDCRILHLDAEGVTFVDKNKLGKNRVKYIPNFRLVMIEQELL